MMDLSDGIASDARRLAEASGVKLVLDASRLPLAEGVESVELAATGGEDYELLVCGRRRCRASRGWEKWSRVKAWSGSEPRPALTAWRGFEHEKANYASAPHYASSSLPRRRLRIAAATASLSTA